VAVQYDTEVFVEFNTQTTSCLAIRLLRLAVLVGGECDWHERDLVNAARCPSTSSLSLTHQKAVTRDRTRPPCGRSYLFTVSNSGMLYFHVDKSAGAKDVTLAGTGAAAYLVFPI